MEDVSDDRFLESNYFRQRINAYLGTMNEHHHHCEHITDFRVIHHSASIEGGELTPTLKLRRFSIEERYRDTIEEMYATSDSWK